MNDKQTIAQFLNVKDFPFEIKDKNNNVIYIECSNLYWGKHEFDLNNNRIYYENSAGQIIDNRPKKELTMQEIAAKLQSIVEDLNKIK